MSDATEPRVEFLILADQVEALNGKLYMMGGGWEKLTVLDFTAPVPLGIAVSIVVPWNASNQQHTVELSVQTADAETLANVTGQFSVGRSAEVEQGASQRSMVALKLPVILPEPGRYVVAARINEGEETRVTFRAIAAPVPAFTG
jgi:hypothetical protein